MPSDPVREETEGGHVFPIDRARRKVLIDGLSKLEYGFARELVDELDATRCELCGGGGYAPYVGGDDDEIPCLACDGSGFKRASASSSEEEGGGAAAGLPDEVRDALRNPSVLIPQDAAVFDLVSAPNAAGGLTFFVGGGPDPSCEMCGGTGELKVLPATAGAAPPQPNYIAACSCRWRSATPLVPAPAPSVSQQGTGERGDLTLTDRDGDALKFYVWSDGRVCAEVAHNGRREATRVVLSIENQLRAAAYLACAPSQQEGGGHEPCPACRTPMVHEVGEGCANPNCDYVVAEPDPEGVNDGIQR